VGARRGRRVRRTGGARASGPQARTDHREQGRTFVYRAARSRERATDRILARITDSLFGGDVPALVSHLLASKKIEKREIDEIRRLLADRERRLK
jgi:BlaI family penicillinase repressor